MFYVHLALIVERKYMHGNVCWHCWVHLVLVDLFIFVFRLWLRGLKSLHRINAQARYLNYSYQIYFSTLPWNASKPCSQFCQTQKCECVLSTAYQVLILAQHTTTVLKYPLPMDALRSSENKLFLLIFSIPTTETVSCIQWNISTSAPAVHSIFTPQYDLMLVSHSGAYVSVL